MSMNLELARLVPSLQQLMQLQDLADLAPTELNLQWLLC